MERLNFYNQTVDINELWYNSHSDLIVRIATELNIIDQIDSLTEKFIGEPLKLKKFKDPDKPKRAKTSYLYFCEEMRPRVKEDNPDLKLGGTMKVLGKMWAEVSEGDKKKYRELYEEDKKRYEEEIDEYNLSSQ